VFEYAFEEIEACIVGREESGIAAISASIKEKI
jgi:hypothetical protein